MWVQSLDQKNPLDQAMATHSSILAWRIPWTEESGGLWSIGLQRVGHDRSDLACMHAYHIFIHLAVEGLLSCFHVLVIVNSAVVNIGVHVSFQISIFGFFYRYIPRSTIAGSYGSSIFSFFVKPTILFSIKSVPSCIPTNSVGGFPFLCILSSICYLQSCDNSLSDRCEVISLCFFDLHFSNNQPS